MNLFDGEFEGYLPPTDVEIGAALSIGMVVLDANVLLDLYRQPAAAREKALAYLRDLSDRLFVPHQVVREFWRNRPGRLSDARKQTSPLAQVAEEIRSYLKRLTPTTGSDDQLDSLRDAALSQIERLDQQIVRASGEPIDVQAALEDPRSDPVVVALAEILEGRVGEKPADEAQMIQEGLTRFKARIPPGYIDGDKKAEQLPERGTGDFLAWEQTLRHLEGLSLAGDFVFVSRDEKADWRIIIDKKAVGALPDLVTEARQRVGQRVIILSPPTFYTFLASSASEVDSEAVESLIATSGSRDDSASSQHWTRVAFGILIDRLVNEGSLVQARTILAAAESEDSFIARDDVYEIGGYEPDRSLRRFTLPARRIALALVDEGILGENAGPPLTALYDGPGQAIGFVVPESISALVPAKEKLSWLDAAVVAAENDDREWWTVSELVTKIRELALRDLSNAKTPEATLGRNLRQRQMGIFDTDGSGRWRLANIDS